MISACHRLNGSRPCITKRCNAYSIRVQLISPKTTRANISNHCCPVRNKNVTSTKTVMPYSAKSARYAASLCFILKSLMNFLLSLIKASIHLCRHFGAATCLMHANKSFITTINATLAMSVRQRTDIANAKVQDRVFKVSP